MDLWHCVGAGLASIFTCLSEFYLFIRRDLLFRLNRAERRENYIIISAHLVKVEASKARLYKNILVGRNSALKDPHPYYY